MNSYAKIEQKLYDDFIRFGYTSDIAKAIAHSFTQYLLGYLTDEQAFDCLIKSGAEESVADAVLESFRMAKKNTPIRSTGARPSQNDLAGVR